MFKRYLKPQREFPPGTKTEGYPLSERQFFITLYFAEPNDPAFAHANLK